jgi:hypothetical protein
VILALFEEIENAEPEMDNKFEYKANLLQVILHFLSDFGCLS